MSAELRLQFASVVFSVPPPSASVPDIAGSVGASATFDGSASTQTDFFRWSWVSVPSGSSYANQIIPLPDGGVNTYFNMTNNQGLWHFEGDADDSSGNGRNGTVNNASLTTGKVGSSAYQFVDTDDSYIDFGLGSTFLSATSSFSMAIWMKGDSGWTPAQYDSVMGFSNAFTWNEGVGIFWENATTIRAFADRYDGATVDATITNVEEWNHLVLTYDGSDLSLYLNGQLSETNNLGASLTGLGNSLQVGRLGTHGRLEASLDEFAIWDRNLSAIEVDNLYFLQSGSAASGSAPNLNLDDEFTFVPDVVGTYQINLAINSTENTNADCVVTSSGGAIINPSNPTVNLVESGERGYVFNTYRIQNLSVQRSRTSEQVPFKLGTKGKQSLRVRTNTEFTGSS